MTSEISKKAHELVQVCMEKRIPVEFVDYEHKENVFEQVTEDDGPIVRLKIGDPENSNLLSEITEFVEKVKELL